MWARLLLCGVVATALLACVDGHAWMAVPAGRSGGTISGASTSSTCNPGSSAVSTVAGSAVTVQGQRANGHGNTLAAAVYTCPTTAACTTTAIGTSGTWSQVTSNVQLSTSVSTTQQITNVNALGSNFIIGTQMTFADGSVWYDCALVSVASSGSGGAIASCATNNGGCDTNANCDGSSGVVNCTCRFPSYYGNGTVCTPTSPDQYVSMYLVLAGNQCDSSLQAQVSAAIATTANIASSLVNYDICTFDGTNSEAYFTISPDRITGAKNYAAQFAIQKAIASGQSILTGRTVLAASGGDAAASAGSGSSSQAWIAAAVLVPLFVLAAFGGGYWYYKKREREGRPIQNPCAGVMTKSTTGKADKTYSGTTATVNTTAASTTTTRFGNTTASSSAVPPAHRPQASAWTAEKDGQGHVYYFNHQTGESSWERPAGVFIPPPK